MPAPIATLLLALCLGSSAIPARDVTTETSVSGTCVGGQGQAIRGVHVRIPSQGLSATSDSAGNFVLRRVTAGVVVIEFTYDSPDRWPKVTLKKVVAEGRNNSVGRVRVCG